MIFKQRHIKQLIPAGILSVVILFFFLNNVLFIHLHENEDGTYVIHAHPYDKKDDSAPYKSHQHDANQLVQLDVQKVLFLEELNSIFKPEDYQNQLIPIRYVQVLESNFFLCFKERAPPYNS